LPLAWGSDRAARIVEMNLSQFRDVSSPWRLRGAHVAGTVWSLRAKAPPRHRRPSRLDASKRFVPFVLAPVLAAVVGGSLLPTENVASASLGVRAVAGAAANRLPFGPLASPIRQLPHKGSATAGVVPFAAAPPKHAKHPAASAPPGSTAGVPAVAIAAYEHAQRVLSETDPSCHLSWEDVAGIGTVESDNGQTWGAAARVTTNGTLFPAIFGIPLDGLNGTPEMRAGGGGWVRAEGPMQFLPATWTEYAQDGNNDGARNPQNFYDAALTTAVFLCRNGGNLGRPAGLTAAILAYNHSDAYVSLVESWIAFYRRVGATAVVNAGSGLLPIGTPRASRVKRPTRVVPLPSPAAVLSGAVLSSEAAGSYSFSLLAFAGTSELATASGAVDTRNETASLVLELPGPGSLQLRLVAGKTYLSLPPALASAAGAEGPWIEMTPLALSRLPAPLAAGLALASDDLSWLVGQLAGATATQVAARASVNGAVDTEYSGETSLALAGLRLPGSGADLGRVAALAGSSELGTTEWVTGNRIQSAVVWLPKLAGEGPVSLHLSFGDYGQPVTVTVPSVSQISPPTTTSTTTTSTSSTTTTTTRADR
jgi:hypothetical protein